MSNEKEFDYGPEDDEQGEDALQGDADEGSLEAQDAAEPASDEGDDGDQGQRGPEEVDPPSRGARRIQRLSQETREANERAARVERELQALRAERAAQQAQSQEMSPEQEAQHLALMTVEERIEYRLTKSERLNQQRLQALAFQQQEMGDRSQFEMRVANDPLAKQLMNEVEAEVQRLRAGGQNAPREAVYYYLLGKKTAEARAGAVDKQRKQGQRNIQRQQARPPAGRGDTPAPRDRAPSQSLERRLGNVQI